MKKRILILAMLLSFVAMSFTSFAFLGKKKNGFKAIQKKGEFVVGLDDAFAPMGFRDENGEIVGFDIDLAKEVANRLGLNVVFKPCEWSGIIFELKSGNIDVIWNGLTITEERKRQINFSQDYLKNSQITVVKKDSEIVSKMDLNGKVIGLQMGSSADKAVSDDPVSKKLKDVKKYENNVDALLDLKNGRVDAVVMDEIVARYYTAKKDGYKVLDADFGKELYGVGFRKGDVKFKEAVDKALDDMIADGTMAEIKARWFGK